MPNMSQETRTEWIERLSKAKQIGRILLRQIRVDVFDESQTDFGKRLSRHWTMISEYENGRQKIPRELQDLIRLIAIQRLKEAN